MDSRSAMPRVNRRVKDAISARIMVGGIYANYKRPTVPNAHTHTHNFYLTNMNALKRIVLHNPLFVLVIINFFYAIAATKFCKAQIQYSN